MKIWIDKQGGLYYHKSDCLLIKFDVPPLTSLYREITNAKFTNSGNLIYCFKTFSPCPICFGHGEDKMKKETRHDLFIFLRYWILGFIIITIGLNLMGVSAVKALEASAGWCISTGIIMWFVFRPLILNKEEKK
jgi:hypothetical protein